jgi:hypothetical protein
MFIIGVIDIARVRTRRPRDDTAEYGQPFRFPFTESVPVRFLESQFERPFDPHCGYIWIGHGDKAFAIVWEVLKERRNDNERDELVPYQVGDRLFRDLSATKFALKPLGRLAKVMKKSGKSGERTGLNLEMACDALQADEVPSCLVDKAISAGIEPITVADEPGNFERAPANYAVTAYGCISGRNCRKLTSQAVETVGSYASRPRSTADTFEEAVEDLLAALTR